MPFGNGLTGQNCGDEGPNNGFCTGCGVFNNTWDTHAYYSGAQGSFTGANAPLTYELTGVTSDDVCAASASNCNCALEIDWKAGNNKDGFRQYYVFSDAKTVCPGSGTPGQHPPCLVGPDQIQECPAYKYIEGGAECPPDRKASQTCYNFGGQGWCGIYNCPTDPTAGQCAASGNCNTCQMLSGSSSDNVPSVAEGGPPGDWTPFTPSHACRIVERF